MKKYIIAFVLVLAGLSTNAQILTNSIPAPAILNSNAFLDASTVYSSAAGENNNKHKGLVYPDVNLTTFVFENVIADGATLPSFYDGMMVYNTGTGPTSTGGLNPSTATAVTPGFYYFSNPDGAANGNVSGGVWKAVGGGTTKFVDGTNAADAVFTGRNVGIGTITPTQKLDVRGGSTLLNGLRLNGTDPNTIYGGTNDINITTDSGKKISLTQTSSPAVGLTVNTTTGNVGIGTAAPTSTLHVVGTGNITGNTAVGGTLGVAGSTALNTTAGTTTTFGATTEDRLIIDSVPQGTVPNTGTITSDDLTAARTYTFPDASGTVLLSSTVIPTFYTSNGSFLFNRTVSQQEFLMNFTNTVTNQSAFSITSSSLTTGNALAITTPVLTTGSALNITSSNGTSNANGVVNIVNTAASGTGTFATLRANSTAGSGLTILNNGNVGIGMAAPTSTLHVAGTTTFGPTTQDRIAIVNSATLTPFTGTITSADLTAARTYTFPDASGTVLLSTSTSNVPNIYNSNGIITGARTVGIDTSLNFDNTTLFINSTNNRIGIGTDNPTGALHVTSGPIKVSSSTATAGYSTMTGGSATNAGSFEIYKQNDTRLGYIGFDNTNLTYVAENGASHAFSGDVRIGNTTGVGQNADLQVENVIAQGVLNIPAGSTSNYSNNRKAIVALLGGAATVNFDTSTDNTGMIVNVINRNTRAIGNGDFFTLGNVRFPNGNAFSGLDGNSAAVLMHSDRWYVISYQEF